jgi:hypothetical protein
MSPAAPPAPHAKGPPFFQPEVVEIPQSVFNSSHGLLPPIETKFTESDAPPTGKMCEYDSRLRGEVKRNLRASWPLSGTAAPWINFFWINFLDQFRFIIIAKCSPKSPAFR